MEYPKLRYIDAFAVETDKGQMIGLRDPAGISPEMLVLSPDVFYILQFFDGTHSQLDIKHEYMRAFGVFLSEAQLAQILDSLDDNLFLDNDTFHRHCKNLESEFLSLSSRPAVHAGISYEAEPQKLKAQIRSFFESPEGAGLPEKNGAPKSIKGLVAPHIDVKAGGSCYSHAYRALAESDGADCFIILGTGHSGLTNLYSTIDKDFETPLGTAKCDSEFITKLRQNYPAIAASEVLPHKNEHVIEFQLVFLKYLYQRRKKFTFVPILCSFSYHMLTDPQFSQQKEIVREFTTALKKNIREFDKKVCLVASVDFCHVGPRYGDQNEPDPVFMKKVAGFDKTLIKNIERLDPEAFCHHIAAQNDRFRVCGFSSIYTLLNIIDAEKGQLLDYSQTEVDSEKSTVTFASMAFH